MNLKKYGFTTDDDKTFYLEHIADNSAVVFRITLTADNLARVELTDDTDGTAIFKSTITAEDLTEILEQTKPDELATMLKYFTESRLFFSRFI
jgi:hypothetical protein